MADIGFFEAPGAPAADPSAFMKQQEMAAALMRRGGGASQGQNVGGHYVAPPTAGYAQQLANALANGSKKNQTLGAARASDILNGGTGEDFLSPLQKIGNLFGGGS
jgi:hypothetical protein